MIECAYDGVWFQAYKTLGFHRVPYPRRVPHDDLDVTAHCKR